MKKIGFYISFLTLLLLAAPVLLDGTHAQPAVAHAALGFPTWQDLINFLTETALNIWYYIWVFIPYNLVLLADELFSLSISQTIVHFGSWYNSLFKDAVDKVWLISRNLANLIIIGMFIFSAVATILRLKDYELEKWIIKIIIVALLINFSMFFAKIAIDVSHAMAYQIYKNSIQSIATVSSTSQNQNQKEKVNVGSVIIRQMGIEKLSNDKEFAKKLSSAEYSGAWVAYPILGLVLVFLAGTLIYGTVVMFTRVLGIILVIGLSAVGFVSLLLPNDLNKNFEKWWKNLLNYSLFAPLFMFMLYITLVIVQYLSTKTSGGEDYGIVALLLKGSWFDALIVPFVIIGLLLASVKISNQLAIVGSNFASWAAMQTIGAGTFVHRGVAKPILSRATALLNKTPLKNTMPAYWVSKAYTNVAAPTSSKSDLHKQFGIKGLNYDQKQSISTALKDIYGEKKLEKPLIDSMIGSGIKRGVAAISSKTHKDKNSDGGTGSDNTHSISSTTRNKIRENVSKQDNNQKELAESKAEAAKRAEEQERQQKIEEAKQQAQHEAAQTVRQQDKFASLDEAQDFINRILNEKPNNSTAEERERWRQRQFRAEKMQRLLNEARKYPALKQRNLATLNNLADKIDAESLGAASKFTEKSADNRKLRLLDKLTKESEQLAETALNDLSYSEESSLKRALGTDSQLTQLVKDTLEDTGLTAQQKLQVLQNNKIIDKLQDALTQGKVTTADEARVKGFINRVSKAQKMLSDQTTPANIISKKLETAVNSSNVSEPAKKALGKIMNDPSKTIMDKVRLVNTQAKLTGDTQLQAAAQELLEYEDLLTKAEPRKISTQAAAGKNLKAAFNPNSKTTVRAARNKLEQKEKRKATLKKLWDNIKAADEKIFFNDPEYTGEGASARHQQETIETAAHNIEKLKQSDSYKKLSKRDQKLLDETHQHLNTLKDEE